VCSTHPVQQWKAACSTTQNRRNRPGSCILVLTEFTLVSLNRPSDPFHPNMPISSVFFAVLDLTDGPKIVYQVPEGLITTPPRSFVSPSSPDPSTGVPAPPSNNTSSTPASAVSPTRPSVGRSTSKAQGSSTTVSSQLSSMTSTAGGGAAPLFEFELISQFTIPQAELCGRLMICTTRKHRIVGFPVILKGPHYAREMFQYNLCFVFQRDLDVSPYEPVVRKVARVLTVCEVSSGALVMLCATGTHRTRYICTERAQVSFGSGHFCEDLPHTRAALCRS